MDYRIIYRKKQAAIALLYRLYNYYFMAAPQN